MADNNEQQEQPIPQPESRQERVCNALTFAGLFAVIAVGGYFIFSDIEKEAEIKAATPTEAPAAEPNFELGTDGIEEQPLPEVQEELPADTVDSIAVGEISADSLDAEIPSHQAHSKADSLHHEPVHHAPAHEPKKHEEGHEPTVPAEETTSE